MKKTNFEKLAQDDSHHESWLVDLHEKYEIAKSKGEEISYEERKNIVDSFVRRNPKTASVVRPCEPCKIHLAEYLLNGRRDVFPTRDEVHRIFEDFGIRAFVGHASKKRRSFGLEKI